MLTKNIKQELNQVVWDIILHEWETGLPIKEADDVINFTIEELIEDKPAILGFGTEREIKNYCHDVFDVVLSKFVTEYGDTK